MRNPRINRHNAAVASQEARSGALPPAFDNRGALIVIVPILPPTVNHMYRSNGRGGKVLTDQAQAFRKLVACEARTTARLTGWHLPAGALRLELLLTFGDSRRCDVDNRAKAALDALALALGFDDARVDEILIRRVGIDPKRPLCEMALSGIPPC